MKRTKKDIVVIICCLIILIGPFLFIGGAYLTHDIRMLVAENKVRARLPDPEADYPAVTELLKKIDSPNMKKGHGFENVNFNNISIGNPIYAYEYIDGQFKNVLYVYPLFEENKMVNLMTIHYSPEISFVPDSYTFEFFADYASCSVAFVYDSYGLNVYDGTEFYPLYEFTDSSRDSIEDSQDLSALAANLVLNEVAPVAPLEYEP